MHFPPKKIPGEWSSLEVARDQLKTAEGKPLASWQHVDKLNLQCKSPLNAPFAVGAFHFISEE